MTRPGDSCVWRRPQSDGARLDGQVGGRSYQVTPCGQSLTPTVIGRTRHWSALLLGGGSFWTGSLGLLLYLVARQEGAPPNWSMGPRCLLLPMPHLSVLLGHGPPGSAPQHPRGCPRDVVPHCAELSSKPSPVIRVAPYFCECAPVPTELCGLLGPS